MIQLPTHKDIQLINILQVTCHPAGSRLEMVGPAKIQPSLQCLIPSAATKVLRIAHLSRDGGDS